MSRLFIIAIIAITAFVGFIFYTTPETPVEEEVQERIVESAVVVTPFDELLREYEAYISESLELSGTPGAAVAIVADSTIIYLRGFGVRNVNTHEPIDTHTVFRLASVSKCLTSVLIGTMVEDGVFSWDDSVTRFIPDFELKSREHTNQLTLRHVLSHTTGLPYHTYTNLIEEGWDHKALIHELKNVDMIGEPGRVYSYQNVVYSIVDDMVASATGNSFANEMKSRVFGPLHMANASLSYEEIISNSNVAQPHLFRGRQWKPIPISSTYYNTAPAGGVNASITDMAKWMVAVLGNKEDVIKKETISQLFEPEVRATAKNRNFNRWSRVKRSYYGLGWRVLNFKNDTIAYHGGYVNGYRSEVAIHPKKRIAICVLANGPSGFSDQALPAFFKIYEKYITENEKAPELIAAP